MEWPAVDDELIQGLPPVLRAVVKALGFGRALGWLLDHGGVNVQIPFLAEQALNLMPDELARMRITLAPHMDKETGRLWMPKADKLMMKLRNAQIRKDKRLLSINALARRERLSSRHILNICRDTDEDQLNLF